MRAKVSIEELLIKLGLKYKKSGNHFVSTCPYCRKDWHFYININNGAWDCKKCQATGNFYKLKYDFDPDFKTSYKPKIKHIETPNYSFQPENYLIRRKISKEVIDSMRIILKQNKVGFIYCDLSSKPYMVKWRSTERKEFFSEPNGTIYYPYAIEKLNFDKGILIICEGEIDVLSWMTYGFDNVIGIPGAGTFKGEWINILKKFKEIYLSLDVDESGIKGAEKIVEKMGEFVVIKTVKLPFKDINDCLTNGILLKEIIKCLDTAKKNYSKDILHAADIIVSSDIDFGVKSEMGKLDKLTTLRKGELSILTGHTKSGKSSFLANVAYNLIYKKYPVLWGSFEMTIEAMKKKFFSLMTGINYIYHRKEDLDFAQNEFERLPLFFINHYGAITIQKLEAVLRYSDKYLDTKYIFLDHLSYMIDNKSPNKVEQIGEILRFIKSLNLELNNHVFIICHPSKTTSENEISEFTLRGSAEIAQICDNLFILRADKDSLISEVELRFARSELAQCGKALFCVNPLISKYTEKVI